MRYFVWLFTFSEIESSITKYNIDYDEFWEVWNIFFINCEFIKMEIDDGDLEFEKGQEVIRIAESMIEDFKTKLQDSRYVSLDYRVHSDGKVGVNRIVIRCDKFQCNFSYYFNGDIRVKFRYLDKIFCLSDARAAVSWLEKEEPRAIRYFNKHYKNLIPADIWNIAV